MSSVAVDCPTIQNHSTHYRKPSNRKSNNKLKMESPHSSPKELHPTTRHQKFLTLNPSSPTLQIEPSTFFWTSDYSLSSSPIPPSPTAAAYAHHRWTGTGMGGPSTPPIYHRHVQVHPNAQLNGVGVANGSHGGYSTASTPSGVAVTANHYPFASTSSTPSASPSIPSAQLHPHPSYATSSDPLAKSFQALSLYPQQQTAPRHQHNNHHPHSNHNHHSNSHHNPSHSNSHRSQSQHRKNNYRTQRERERERERELERERAATPLSTSATFEALNLEISRDALQFIQPFQTLESADGLRGLQEGFRNAILQEHERQRLLDEGEEGEVVCVPMQPSPTSANMNVNGTGGRRDGEGRGSLDHFWRPANSYPGTILHGYSIPVMMNANGWTTAHDDGWRRQTYPEVRRTHIWGTETMSREGGDHHELVEVFHSRRHLSISLQRKTTEIQCLCSAKVVHSLRPPVGPYPSKLTFQQIMVS
ncbi:hypothetical protein BT69DRAFT_1295206 [Atractiella rhizophila]|nr:hypothetical protein BT69DRAFT_1295206 [Atractiella rhizophila]